MIGDEVPKPTPTETATPTAEQTLTPEQQKAAEMTQLLKQENESFGGHLLSVIPNGDGREVVLFKSYDVETGIDYKGISFTVNGVHPDLGAFKVGGRIAANFAKRVDPSFGGDTILSSRIDPLEGYEKLSFQQLESIVLQKEEKKPFEFLQSESDLRIWTKNRDGARQNAEKLLGEEQKRREIAQLQDKALEMLKSPAQPPATPGPPNINRGPINP